MRRLLAARGELSPVSVDESRRMHTGPPSGNFWSSPGDTARLSVRPRTGRPDHVVVVGELDMAGAPLLEGALRAAMHRGHRDVVVDARQLTFCDAAGLHVLIAATAELRAFGGQLTVYGPCQALQALLDVVEDATIELAPAPPD